ETTIVRDGVFVTRSTSPATAAVTLRDAGDVALRNLDAWSGFGADGVDCAITSGAAARVNVPVRRTASDVDATGNTARCSAEYSNLRPAAPPGLALGAGIQSDEPMLVDASSGDWRQRPGSPTIDAGTDDPLLSERDPDGRERWIGAA